VACRGQIGASWCRDPREPLAAGMTAMKRRERTVRTPPKPRTKAPAAKAPKSRAPAVIAAEIAAGHAAARAGTAGLSLTKSMRQPGVPLTAPAIEAETRRTRKPAARRSGRGR
jgi:hypothetical protein